MANWQKTDIVMKRLEEEGKVDQKGLYGDRHIIGRDTPIDGGVYLGADSREAIVVDSRKYPAVGKLYEIAKDEASTTNCHPETGEYFNHCDPTTGEEIIEEWPILWSTYQTVIRGMRYDDEGVERLVQMHGVENDGKIALDVFIEGGIGICRHQALACGAVLELFKKDGFIKGNVSIDRNSDAPGGHGWCRYTSPNGEVTIIDPALKFFGPLERASREGHWAYQRPEDFIPAF